jgi:Fe-S-cluster-containing dehydrogenase component
MIFEPKPNGISRRGLFKLSAGLFAGATGIASLPKQLIAAPIEGKLATLIDLSLCDGCADKPQPACVTSCKQAKNHTIPAPVDPIPSPFPTNLIEDWSKKQGVSNRLTPYNRIFVQKAEASINGRMTTVSIPRRCMHCDNPACATICPFSANTKDKSGAVVIDQERCFGGAKCKNVCPWEIPQRQSGVGIYLKVAKEYMGNGVMYKCDLCIDRLKEGKTPACIETCPKKAMTIGPRELIYAEAEKRAKAINGYLFGKNENGGSSTLYLSPVPFTDLEKTITPGKGQPALKPGVKRKMAESDAMGKLVLAAPAIGLMAGLVGAFTKISKRKSDNAGKGE